MLRWLGVVGIERKRLLTQKAKQSQTASTRLLFRINAFLVLLVIFCKPKHEYTSCLAGSCQAAHPCYHIALARLF